MEPGRFRRQRVCHVLEPYGVCPPFQNKNLLHGFVGGGRFAAGEVSIVEELQDPCRIRRVSGDDGLPLSNEFIRPVRAELTRLFLVRGSVRIGPPANRRIPEEDCAVVTSAGKRSSIG